MTLKFKISEVKVTAELPEECQWDVECMETPEWLVLPHDDAQGFIPTCASCELKTI